MALVEYRKKRHFDKTPEPKGSVKRTGGSHQFIIQKHAARRLHYDFRLELDGVLKSWAVPKGPSLDPSVKSLAVHVEDHPIEYGSFEGVIPQGEYGGGTVMLWDRGTWIPEGDARKAYRRGKLMFRLEGEKLHGRWALVRMGGAAGEQGKNWLLKKMNDEEARGGDEAAVTEKLPNSVATGRTLEQIAKSADRVWTSKGESTSANGRSPKKAATKRAAAKKQTAKKSSTGTRKTAAAPDLAAVTGAKRRALPRTFQPQLATLVKEAPEGDEWLHELKYDGYRLLCMIKKGEPHLLTRHGHDWSDRFPSVVAAARELGVDEAIIDGEVVVLGPDGTSDFQALQNHMQRGRDDEIVFFVFDLPYCGGYDLTATPLIERKELLRQLMQAAPEDGALRYSDHITGQGAGVFERACRLAVEGIISKRADSPYEQRRSGTWVKVKCLKRQEFVIGGWSDPSGSREAFGSLLLGYYDDDGKLIYCGRVGTGFTAESLQQIKADMDRYQTDKSPFHNAPRARDSHWIEPRLVAEVEFTQWTSDGLLRHPTFEGLREDKSPQDVRREEPVNSPAENGKPRRRTKRAEKTLHSVPPRSKAAQAKAGAVVKTAADNEFAGVRLSNPERVLYPEQGLTKRDLARYYTQVGEWIMPYLLHRPLTLVRCPQGRQSKCFYQKHISESVPKPVRGVEVPEKNGTGVYVAIDDLAGLITLVQIGVLEIHPWGSREDKLDYPDMMIFDLDPAEDVGWTAVVAAAGEMRARLSDLKLESFLRTTGGKGLHVVVPLVRRATWDDVKELAKQIAQAFVRNDPEHYISIASKAKRRGKIYVDYLRNDRGSTAIGSYATRARHGAPVATPLSWDELSPQLKPADFNIQTVPERLTSLGKDPWQGYFETRQAVSKGMLQQVKKW